MDPKNENNDPSIENSHPSDAKKLVGFGGLGFANHSPAAPPSDATKTFGEGHGSHSDYIAPSCNAAGFF